MDPATPPAALPRALRSWLCLLWAAGFGLSLGGPGALAAIGQASAAAASPDHGDRIASLPPHGHQEDLAEADTELEEDEDPEARGRRRCGAPSDLPALAMRWSLAPQRRPWARAIDRGLPARGPPAPLL